MWKSKRSKHDNFTTVEPLNYLLRARSKRTLVFWSIMTVASFAAVIGTCTALVMKYQRQDTNVLTRLTDGRFSSFPAVTLCNMNPYKKSVLSTIPPAAHLMKMYEINLNSINSASTESSQNRQLNSDEIDKNVATKSIADDENKESNGAKRVKRSDREVDSCRCDYTNAITTANSSASSSTYVLYANIRTTWECIFQCCENLNGRPAKLENKSTIQFLARNGLLDGEIWVPMRCLNQTCNWYTSPSTPSGRSHMLDSCMQSDADKISESSTAVGIRFDRARNKVTMYQDRTDTGYKCLCEATPVPDFTYSTEGGPTISASAATEMPVLSAKIPVQFAVLSSAPSFSIPSDKQKQKQKQSDTAVLVSEHSTESDQKTSITSTDSVSTVASLHPPLHVLETTGTSESIINQTIEQILGDPMVNTDHIALGATGVDILQYVMSQYPAEMLSVVGYDSTETIMRSFYNKERLAYWNFTLHYDPNYGNCYTFNLFGSDMASIQPGPEKGFSMAYLIGEEEYPSFVQSSGVRVIIHQQGYPIFPDVNGYSVASRTRSSISLKKSKTEAITTRKKKCVVSPSDVDAYVFKDGRYTVEACLRSCHQTGVIKNCKCGDPRIPLPTNSTVRFCDVTKIRAQHSESCVDAYYNNSQKPECRCLPECELHYYDATLSTTVWSSGYVSHEIDNKVMEYKLIFQDTSGIFASADYVSNSTQKQSMAMIDVYLESLTTVVYVEVFGYKISDLLWDMSAVMGLFTGMSVISIFESIYCVQFLLEKHRK